MSSSQIHRRANAAFRLAIASLVLLPLYTIARATPIAEQPAAAPAGPAASLPLLARASVLPVAVQDLEGIERRIYRDGRVYVAGQPSEEALAELARRGVTAVVNLRTESEMADRSLVPFDEAAVAARLGLDYVEVPVGGSDHPYRPEVLDRLRDVLASHPGPVLLHCHSGNRASYVWTAYLVRDGGMTLDEALAHGRAIAIPPDPIGELLGRSIEMRLGDATPPSLE